MSFNPHPPRRRMLHGGEGDRQALHGLSILIRHEGGCYASATGAVGDRLDLSILIRHEGGCYESIERRKAVKKTFQSSSATKADATLNPTATRSISRTFNPHPPRKRMLPTAFAEVDERKVFQSSSATKADAT